MTPQSSTLKMLYMLGDHMNQLNLLEDFNRGETLIRSLPQRDKDK